MDAELCVAERTRLANKLEKLGATRRGDEALANETCFDIGHQSIVLSIIIDPDMSGNSMRSRVVLSLLYPTTVFLELVWITGERYQTDADGLDYAQPRCFSDLVLRASSDETAARIAGEIRRVTEIMTTIHSAPDALVG